MDMQDVAVGFANSDARLREHERRIDDVEKRQDNLDGLVASFTTLAKDNEYIKKDQEGIKKDVIEIKTDVKALSEKPGKRWDSIVEKCIWAVVGGVIIFLLSQIGIS